MHGNSNIKYKNFCNAVFEKKKWVMDDVEHICEFKRRDYT